MVCIGDGAFMDALGIRGVDIQAIIDLERLFFEQREDPYVL